MTLRTIKQFGDIHGNTVKVTLDVDWGEYQCTPYYWTPRGMVARVAARYHTDDREDALGTAKKMLEELTTKAG